MEMALPLDAFVTSDIAVRVHFDSAEITFDDTAALVQLLKAIIDAAQFEIATQTGVDFEILPVVSVARGSIDIRVDVRPSHWTLTVKAKAREVVLAIALLLGPNPTVAPPQPLPPPVSAPCEDMIRTATEEAFRTWQYYGKGFKASFEISCGDTTIKSSVDVPSSRSR